MRDGQTMKITRAGDGGPEAAFLESHQAALVTLSGTTAGNEYPLEQAPMTLGRGPGVDLAFDDNAMSKQHAAFELSSEGFRVRDMGSTNGMLVNGSPAQAADLKHGDRLAIGQHEFQYVVEARSRKPRTWVVDDDA